jgi:hypothetical protein
LLFSLLLFYCSCTLLHIKHKPLVAFYFAFFSFHRVKDRVRSVMLTHSTYFRSRPACCVAIERVHSLLQVFFRNSSSLAAAAFRVFFLKS